MHSPTSFARRSFAAKRAIPLIAVVAVAAILTGCSGRGTAPASTSSSSKFSTVTIVTPATESDHGWNQMGLAGATAAAKATSLKLTSDTNVGYDNTQTILTQAAQKSGVGFVIAHASGFGQAAAQANAKTGVPFLITDVPTAQVKDKIGVITFSAQQGGYLAGIAAAMTTKTNKLGIAISADDVNWFTMSGGFIAGAKSVNPSIHVDVAYIGAAAYDDSAGGKKVVQQLIAAGDDVVFGMGDGATVGYVAAVDEANQAGNKVKYIADIGDVSDLVTNADEVLTSVLWVFDGAYTQAIKDIKAGTFARSTYNLDLKNGGIKLQKTADMTSAITAATAKAQSGIEDGSITVPDTTTKAQLTALLN
ncbi:MAG: family transporter substrate-binding protein [Microbacteriaceae bacterium]|jgi:basic membrane protein A|nr:family transporter substrate-binding protein [Microbacteriaceae bacterium]